MKDVYIYVCSITESNGKRRVSEYRCSGIVDDDGNFKLKGCCGRIYPVETIETINDYNKLPESA